MRTITSHQTNAANRAITIKVDDRDPDNGNASHHYVLSWQDAAGEQPSVQLDFQHGPIAEVGVNGVTNEALLAIVADRLLGFQSGKFASPHNDDAFHYIQHTLEALRQRTEEREARGVEGTHEV